MAPKYNTYVLGGTPELDLTVYDTNNTKFIPLEARLSIKTPPYDIHVSGQILTYSGGDMSQGSGYLYIYYRPPVKGWYEYESWAKDGAGRETTATNGFEVVDRVY